MKALILLFMLASVFTGCRSDQETHKCKSKSSEQERHPFVYDGPADHIDPIEQQNFETVTGF